MPKRSSKENDPILAAKNVLDQIIAKHDPEAERLVKEMVDAIKEGVEAESRKNPAAVVLGRLGGKSGGPARARSLSPQRRSEIAVQAARTRWERVSKPSKQRKRT